MLTAGPVTFLCLQGGAGFKAGGSIIGAAEDKHDEDTVAEGEDGGRG